ncbi:serine/threonine-protein kinase [Cupriavidus oxalaticus]|uniref:serine/threonine-protein kinase n=1 Tax=Cupriavidus oxalaticus TaxID=96344 RepID=UPI00317601FE
MKNFLAAGGMQEVYVCFDRTLEREVVVKTPKAGIKDRRFRRGAEMGARVHHHNVAATFDYYEDADLTFLVEEYIVGVDLGRRLETEFVFMDPSLAAHVIHHIAKALHEAHSVGICHRDLKPSNVMTSADASINVIKLTDFGIAKLAESEIAAELELFEQDQSTLTTSNTLLGAVPYMAPECWEDWKNAGQPMDIWALGCVAYHLLHGTPPFGSGRQAFMNIAKLLSGGPLQLARPTWFGTHKNTEALENGLWGIIEACIQVNPAARPKAEDVMRMCQQLCYATAIRKIGTITEYPGTYSNGNRGDFGRITDDVARRRWFFHLTEFFGQDSPEQGQRVSFSVYPGVPHDRSAPVLGLRR